MKVQFVFYVIVVCVERRWILSTVFMESILRPNLLVLASFNDYKIVIIIIINWGFIKTKSDYAICSRKEITENKVIIFVVIGYAG